ncbi:tyrosine phosphatase [Culex quinquefasciatus]|uniref:Tyrosine phosphatase n=1 Tax=Culex quinquefasciatus TaxID=7176 RepID=B0W178_CULQU|nr:tyrosine phosphatase [Culex quinquefasciatus]|eukprot:XP_001842462.1 tyrosine phosphatase [Culex quinquefasciatus]
MLALVWMICAASNIALATSNVIKPSGKITISPSVVDLDSNVTFYTVCCRLDSVQDGLDSSSLHIELQNERIKSEILNESTIVAVQQVNSGMLEKCGVWKYTCYSGGSGLDVARVTVGRIPANILPAEIRCISEDLRDLRCEVPIKRPCDLETSYKMMMNYRFGSSLCSVDVVGGNLVYDSSDENQRCIYRNGVEALRFELEVINAIGRKVMSFELNNYDLVRPGPVVRLRVINVTSRDLEIRWVQEMSLDHLQRTFEYQFQLISDHGSNISTVEKTPTMIYQYSMNNLQPFTNYTLKVRLWLVPKTPRSFDDEYWSEWRSVSFKTLASKPDQAPKTVPGAFSFKAWHDKLATFDVYWEHVPKYLQNGPGFRYNVSAISDTGQTFYPVQSPSTSPVATFENMNNAHFRVLISCFNDEGSVENHNELHVFPPNPSHQPKIKRVLNSAHFEVSWHAPTHQQDLTSYTVMYCNYTSANVCQDSIRFAVVPPNTTDFRISSTSTLNFAVSANFAHFSTPLSWQECIVSPADLGIGQPKFDVIDLRGDSLVLLFNNGCIERSFYDQMRLLVWKGMEVVLRADFETYRDRFAVQGLSPGTEYAVQVLAYDGLKMVQHTRTVVTKAINDSTESNSSVFDYPIQNLNPFTEYKLGVRLRVIPRSVRLLDEEYWSGWSWTSFKTEARRPGVAPRTIPGAFSFKDHKEDRATLEVYWEPMLESQWNGPGFRYNVSAVTDTGQWFFPVNDFRDLPYEVATFEDITLDHYRILVSCYNDKGSFQGSNIMEVFPPKQSFNVSWYPPSVQTGISNYTVMYCNLTSSSSCKDSIRFVTVPSTNTSFSVSSPTVLNFAVSANYPTHSSDFSWQQCLVSPGADIGSPQFVPCNVTDTSFDIRMTTTCSSSSLYELLEVYVLAKNGSHIWNTSLEQPQKRISIGDLSPDTEYVVKIVAFDESGNLHETSKTVQTAPKYTKLQLTLFFLCGVLLVFALTMGTTRKVNSLRNIHVEMPVALQTLFGIDGEETVGLVIMKL